ncbi:MAG TPA: DUF6279 family lipoprotein [Burkholderiaceae bacterium]|nr:DUF6279 family lipoprotein [Burkholderiaceae bacterium]
MFKPFGDITRLPAKMAGQSSTGSWRRYVAWAMTACAVLIVAACSTVRFGYNHADTVLLLYVDNYLDLDERQEQLARDAVRKVLAWHRVHELPGYVNELTTVRDNIETGRVTPENVAALNEAITASIERTLAFAAPLLSDVVQTLKPDQIAHLRRKIDKNNAEFKRQYLTGTLDDQQQARADKLVEQFERWFGKLDRHQRDELRALADARSYDNATWFAERQRRQQLLFALINDVQTRKPTGEQATKLLARYIDEFERPRHADARAVNERMRVNTRRLIADMIGRMTDAQRATAVKRVQRWIDDFRLLQTDSA